MKNKRTKISNEIVHLEPLYTTQVKKQLRNKISQYGTFLFSDDIWYCEKMRKGVSYANDSTITFSKAHNKYKDILKYFALVSENSIKVIRDKVKYIIYFLNYLEDNFPDTQLQHVNQKIMVRFEHYLREDINLGLHTKRHTYDGISDFFQTMSEFPELPQKIPTKKRNPFYKSHKKNSEKYIPQYVIKQFDKVMKNEENCIPLILRVIYWLQRSFPNRIKEVCSIKINPLKPVYSYHILSIPTWKQNGGYLIEEIKTIPILNSGHGNYIIELLKRWEQERNILVEKFPFKKDFDDTFLLHPPFSISIENGKVNTHCWAIDNWEVTQLSKKQPDKNHKELTTLLHEKGIYLHPTSVKNQLENKLNRRYIEMTPFSSQKFNRYFKQIAQLFNITDEQGNVYDITSHQFRHNATTDRLYIGGYTIDQMKILRNDKGDNMMMQYAHQQKEFHKKMWMDSIGLKKPSEAPVEYKGIIQNLSDKRVINRLSRMPSAYLTWEANSKKGVGLCSNIIGCNPKGTDIHFECYECDWFVPKAEYYNDYKKELEYWNNIMNSAANIPSRAATFENAIRNVNCLERIIAICENGIKRHKQENATN